MEQSSLIFHLRYKVSSTISFVLAYHRISNPAKFASDILDTEHEKFDLGEKNKVKLSLACKF